MTKHQNPSKLFVISNTSVGHDKYGFSEKVFFIGLGNKREFNDHCGDDENIQNRDDMEFDEHIDYGVEDSGLMNNLENEQVINVPVDVAVDVPVDDEVDGPVDVAVDSPVDAAVDGLVDVAVEGLVDDADYGPIDVPITIHEQEIMTQEDLDFFNEFDFSTPFEDQPLPFQDQHVSQKDKLVLPPEELVPPCDQLPVPPSDVLPIPPTSQGILQTKHGVSICHGQPPKSKQGKSKSRENHHPTNDKGKKPKLRKRYMTRTATSFKFVFFGNMDDPLTID
nr:uncharacterized protein LOC109192291 [Ipomoea batatas]